MIHYWECSRCTHEWQSSCMGEMMTPKDKQERNHRQMSSDLCWDCFEQLEIGEIDGLELFDLAFYLREKYEKLDRATSSKWVKLPSGDKVYTGYSGMCKEYRSPTFDEKGAYLDKGNFEMPWTAEEKQLSEIASDVKEVYSDAIKQQRTRKRVELDEWQKQDKGFVFFGSQPRPDGFVGDPPGKQRFVILFGLDLAENSFVPPTITVNNGVEDGRL